MSGFQHPRWLMIKRGGYTGWLNGDYCDLLWRKGCDWTPGIAILPQFLAIEPHFVRKGSRDKRDKRNRNFTSVFGDRTSFRAKGLRGTTCKSQFYLSFWRSNLISCERVAFRAVSLALPRAFKREIEQERNRKEGEGKMTRGEDVKMWGCGDEQMWGWEDVKMRRCEDEKMWRWEDVKMRRCFTDPHYWKNPALRRSREKLCSHPGVDRMWAF